MHFQTIRSKALICVRNSVWETDSYECEMEQFGQENEHPKEGGVYQPVQL